MIDAPEGVHLLADRPLRTFTGIWHEYLFRADRQEVSVLTFENYQDEYAPLCRFHSFCLSSQVLMSAECDCHEQMVLAQEAIVTEGRGIIVVLDQDGRGFGHEAHVKASVRARTSGIAQSEAYLDMYGSVDSRNYEAGLAVLKCLDVEAVRMLTNNPRKITALEHSDIKLVGSVRLRVANLAGRPELASSYADKRALGHLV